MRVERGLFAASSPLGLVGTGGEHRGMKAVMGTVEINPGVLGLPPRHLTTRNQSNHRVI